MQIKLICHGLMLFWYRPPNTAPFTEHGYTIFIPHGIHNGQRAHELQFGIGAGAAEPHPWLIYAGNTPAATRHLALQLRPVYQTRARGPKDPHTNLNLYRNDYYEALRNETGIAFTIDIPYPADEKPVRVADYIADPYRDGNVVRAFDIHSRRIVGARVFIFEVPDAPSISVVDIDTHDELEVPGRTAADTRLHLYSQPATRPSHRESHLHMLNEMLRLRTRDGSAADRDFDLDLNDRRQEDIDPQGFAPPQELGFKDLLHLWEFRTIFSVGEQSKHSHADDGESKRFIDPAECGQGGGC